MFIGHFAVALAAKNAAPRVPLGTLVLAAQFVDVIWPFLLLLGVEHVRIDPGKRLVTFYEDLFSGVALGRICRFLGIAPLQTPLEARVHAGQPLTMTADQRFFYAVGQGWCAKYRLEFAHMMADVDPHSPPRWRVNGPMTNFAPFAAAFNCAAGTPMNPDDKCEVW